MGNLGYLMLFSRPQQTIISKQLVTLAIRRVNQKEASEKSTPYDQQSKVSSGCVSCSQYVLSVCIVFHCTPLQRILNYFNKM